MPRNPKPKVENHPRAAEIRRRLTAWFRQDGRDLPWRRDTSPYAVMVSEFMLQQTQVATVIPYFERWMLRFPNFATLAEASETEVLSLWQGLGYYSRARNLQRAAREVVARFGGVLPADLAAIESLPGIGRYTAGAIMSFAFDRPVATVDGNIARVLSRIFDFREPVDTPSGVASTYELAEALLPATGGRLHTSALMELGALLCSPRQPRCPACPIRNHCAADAPESLPMKRPRAKTIALEEHCGFAVGKKGVFLEEQRGSRWRGMWKLPVIATRPSAQTPVHRATYPFTNHRVTLLVYPVASDELVSETGRWVQLGELAALPVTAPHRRAIEALLSDGTSPS